MKSMAHLVRVEFCSENDPERVIFVADLPDYPRPGDIVGDLVGGTYRVEKRLFLVGRAVDGVRPLVGFKALCKSVIV